MAFDLQQARRDPEHLKPVVLFAPGARESLGEAAATRDALLVTTFDNVRGRAFVYRRRPDATWQRSMLALPDNTTIDIADADLHSDNAFLSVAGFLQPTSRLVADVAVIAPLARIKTLPAKFDASREAVEQFEATSTRWNQDAVLRHPSRRHAARRQQSDHSLRPMAASRCR